jgi:hypothetical protein
MASLYGKPGEPAVDAERERFAALRRGGGFELYTAGRRMFARRVSWVPRGGLLSLFVPRATVWWRGERWRVRPDRMTIFVTVMVIGGLIVELTMDRARYPREYPPAFVYGYSLGFLGLLIREIVVTRRSVRRALAGEGRV